MILAGQEMSDHTVIRYREGLGPDAHISRFMPWHSAAEHRLDLPFLVAQPAVPFDGPSVIVTHHLPGSRSIAARFQGSSLNPAFASALEWLIERSEPLLWVHGHTHSSCDYHIGTTRILCNPKGYGPDHVRQTPITNPQFYPRLVIEVRK